MDIKNILNKDGAAELPESESETDSDKSGSGSYSPKSTASAPTLSVAAGPAGDAHSLRRQTLSSSAQREQNTPTSTPIARDFVCTTCHKTFARRSDLVRHGTFPFRQV